MCLDRPLLVAGLLAGLTALVAVACSNDSSSPTAATAVVGGATAASGAVSLDAKGGNEKIVKQPVCHVTEDGSYHLIKVNASALPAHMAHGDAQPGDPVPGEPSKKFDEECNKVDAVACPCHFGTVFEDLVALGYEPDIVNSDPRFTRIEWNSGGEPVGFSEFAVTSQPADPHNACYINGLGGWVHQWADAEQREACEAQNRRIAGF